jgi:hypothetical protein
MLAPQNLSDGAAIQIVKVPVEGNGDAATAAPGSGITVLSDPILTAPVLIDNPQLLDMQPMWADCPTSDKRA